MRHAKRDGCVCSALIISSNFLNIDLTESLSLTNRHSGLIGKNCCLTVAREGISIVMHNTLIIVGTVLIENFSSPRISIEIVFLDEKNKDDSKTKRKDASFSPFPVEYCRNTPWHTYLDPDEIVRDRTLRINGDKRLLLRFIELTENM